MGYEDIQSLNCAVVISLGGFNKKTGKANPTTAEGYYLGSRSVESKKSKSGFSKIHVLKTPKGNLGVWGKTDLDTKITAVPAGCMIKVTQEGMMPTSSGNDMYLFRVQVDKSNKIAVSVPTAEAGASGDDDGYPDAETDAFGDYEEPAAGEDDDVLDEVAPVRTAPAKRAANTPGADAIARTRSALLGGGKRSA